MINNISKLPKPLPAPIKNKKYDLNILKKSVDKDIPKRFHDQFGSLVNELSDIFATSVWDLGKCDVTTHQIEVEPRSKPVKIPVALQRGSSKEKCCFSKERIDNTMT